MRDASPHRASPGFCLWRLQMKSFEFLFKRALAVGAVGAAVLAGTAATASAADMFYACIKADDGSLSQISMNVQPTCKAGRTMVQWNAVGPAGPAGMAGADGLSEAIQSKTSFKALYEPQGHIVGKVALDPGAYLLTVKGFLMMSYPNSKRHVLGCSIVTAPSIDSPTLADVDWSQFSLEPVLSPTTSSDVPLHLAVVVDRAEAFEFGLVCTDYNYADQEPMSLVSANFVKLIAVKLNTATGGS
jgi:hypothetical protein